MCLRTTSDYQKIFPVICQNHGPHNLTQPNLIHSIPPMFSTPNEMNRSCQMIHISKMIYDTSGLIVTFRYTRSGLMIFFTC